MKNLHKMRRSWRDGSHVGLIRFRWCAESRNGERWSSVLVRRSVLYSMAMRVPRGASYQSLFERTCRTSLQPRRPAPKNFCWEFWFPSYYMVGRWGIVELFFRRFRSSSINLWLEEQWLLLLVSLGILFGPTWTSWHKCSKIPYMESDIYLLRVSIWLPLAPSQTLQSPLI